MIVIAFLCGMYVGLNLMLALWFFIENRSMERNTLIAALAILITVGLPYAGYCVAKCYRQGWRKL